MRIAVLVLWLMAVMLVSVTAQDGYPLPDDLAPITPANAARLQQLASIGEPLAGRLLWSPDNTKLVVQTSEALQIYDATDFSLLPIIIPVYSDNLYSGNMAFNTDGEFVYQNKRFDVQTGALLGAVEPQTASNTDPTNGITVEAIVDNGLTVIELTKPDGEVIELATRSNFVFRDILFNAENTVAAVTLGEGRYSVAVQLWNIENGSFVREIPLLGDVDTLMFRGNILVVASVSDAPYGGPFEQVGIWHTVTGDALFGTNFVPIIFSGEFMAMYTGSSIALWSDHAIATLQAPNLDVWDSEGGRPIIFFNRNNQLVAAVENNVYVWNITGDVIQPEPAHTLTAEASVVSAFDNRDGSLLITLEQEGIIEIWDAETLTLQRKLVDTSSGSGSLSADGTLLLRAFKIWNIESGELEMTVPPNTVLSVDWSMGSYWDNGIVRIIYRDGRPDAELVIIPNVMGFISAYNPSIGWVIFSHDGLTGYDLSTGESVYQDDSGRVTFSDGGQYLLRNNQSTTDYQISVYATDNLTQPIFQSQSARYLIQISPDGQYLAEIQSVGCGGEGGIGYITIHDTIQKETLFDWSDFWGCGPYQYEFTPDNNWLIVTWDFDIAFIPLDEPHADTDVASAFEPTDSVKIFYLNHSDIYFALSPDSTLIALSADGNAPGGDSIAAPREIKVFRLADIFALEAYYIDTDPLFTIPDASARTALFSPDNQFITSENGVWHVESGEQIGVFDATVAAFNHDSSLLATYEQNTITLWDVDTLLNGHGIAELMTINVEGVQSLAFNPDGTLLYIQRRGDVQVWGVR